MKINPILKKEWLVENQKYIQQSKADFKLILKLIELISSNDWEKFYPESSNLLHCKQTIECINKVNFNNQSTISAVYIVKNERDTLLKSLESLNGLADEIIIVDTGSTDGPLEMLATLSKNDGSISLYSFEWCDDFSKARNFANSKANGDWIISFDADEKITDFKSLKLLLTYLQIFGDYPKTVFNLNIVRDEITYKTGKIIQNLPCFSYKGRVHETYFSAVGDVHYANIDIDIISQNRTTSEKVEYYNRLLLLTIKDEPLNLRWLYLYLRDNFDSIKYTQMKELSHNYLFSNSSNRNKENFKENYYNVRVILLHMYKALQNGEISDFEKYQQLISDVAYNQTDYIFLKFTLKLLRIQERISNDLEEMLIDCCEIETDNSIFSVNYLNSVLATYLLLDGNPQKSKEMFRKLFGDNSDFPCFLTISMKEFLLGNK